MPKPKQTAIVKSSPKVEFLQDGLMFHAKLSFEEWYKLGHTLAGIHAGLNWWVGDFLLYGEGTYGEKFAQVENDLGYDHDALIQMAWVSRRLPINTRVGGLSWSAHRAMASLEDKDMEAVLKRAQSEKMTVVDVVEAVKAIKGQATAETGRECPTCGRTLPRGFNLPK